MIAPIGTGSVLSRCALVLLLGVLGALHAEHAWQVRCLRVGAVRCEGTRCVVRRARVHDLLEHPSHLGSAARIVPVGCAGHGGGVRIYSIQPASLLAMLGLRSGDTLHSVNGVSLSSPDKAIGLYHMLRTARQVAVELDRGGRAMTLHYTIL